MRGSGRYFQMASVRATRFISRSTALLTSRGDCWMVRKTQSSKLNTLPASYRLGTAASSLALFSTGTPGVSSSQCRAGSSGDFSPALLEAQAGKKKVRTRSSGRKIRADGMDGVKYGIGDRPFAGLRRRTTARHVNRLTATGGHSAGDAGSSRSNSR